MGSKLAALAAVIVLGAAGAALADDPKDLFKQGVDAYKAGRYDESARLLKRSYDKDPNPNTLFALAQSERLLGECKLAVEHYKKVIEEVNDLNVAKLVQQNLSLCEKQEPTAEPVKTDGGAAAPEPKIITKTVTRDVGHTDKVAVTAMVFGTLSLGAAGGLYLAASANKDAANNARTLDSHNSFADKASSETTGTYIAAGLGAALVGVAVYRWATGSGSESSPAVAVVPQAAGGSLVVSARW